MDKSEFEERFGSFENNSGLYCDMLLAVENKSFGSIIHVVTYMFAEMVTEKDIPKNEFVAFMVEQFDNAYKFLEQEKGMKQ